MRKNIRRMIWGKEVLSVRIEMKKEPEGNYDALLDEIMGWLFKISRKSQKKNRIRNIVLGTICTISFFIMAELQITIFLAVPVFTIGICFFFALIPLGKKTIENTKKNLAKDIRSYKNKQIYYDFEGASFRYKKWPKLRYDSIQHYVVTEKFAILQWGMWNFIFVWDAIPFDQVNDFKILLLEKFPMMSNV